MKAFIPLASACASLALAWPVQAFDLTHSDGVVQAETTPQRIISYDLSVADSLNALGVSLVGVPQSTYKQDLAPLDQLPKVGTLFEPDYAVLKELQPDLIFAGGRSQNAVAELTTIAPTAVYNTRPTHFLEDFKANNTALAAAFDKTQVAQTYLADVEQKVTALQQANKGKTGAFLFVMKDNVMPHVPGDRFGYTYEITGLESVLAAKEPTAVAAPRPEPGSPEAKAAAAERAKQVAAIADANPDWLVVLDRGAIAGGEATAQATIQNHPELSQTDAVKAGRVMYVEPDRWYVIGGGLANFNVLLDQFLEKMAP